MGIYLFNILVIASVGRLLTTLLPEETPGLILEMPVYRVPTFKTVFGKAWFRVREFLVEAWPLLIAGSLALADSKAPKDSFVAAQLRAAGAASSASTTT